MPVFNLETESGVLMLYLWPFAKNGSIELQLLEAVHFENPKINPSLSTLDDLNKYATQKHNGNALIKNGRNMLNLAARYLSRYSD